SRRGSGSSGTAWPVVPGDCTTGSPAPRTSAPATIWRQGSTSSSAPGARICSSVKRGRRHEAKRPAPCPAPNRRRCRRAETAERRTRTEDSLEEVGTVSERAAVGHGTRGLQHRWQRLELL